MQTDDLIRRNRELLEEPRGVRETTRTLTAEKAGYRSAVDHARERAQKLIRARALWPRFRRRIYPADARPS